MMYSVCWLDNQMTWNGANSAVLNTVQCMIGKYLPTISPALIPNFGWALAGFISMVGGSGVPSGR
jgi:hypothetical protein